jgi:hypothetical protein
MIEIFLQSQHLYVVLQQYIQRRDGTARTLGITDLGGNGTQ